MLYAAVRRVVVQLNGCPGMDVKATGVRWWRPLLSGWVIGVDVHDAAVRRCLGVGLVVWRLTCPWSLIVVVRFLCGRR